MKTLTKGRTNPLCSKRKIITAINLFEEKIDESFQSIKVVSSTYYFSRLIGLNMLLILPKIV